MVAYGAALTALLVLVALLPAGPVRAQDTAEAASGPPVNIGIFLSSDPKRCYHRGYDAAIRRLSEHQADVVNRRGGINGRPLRLVYFDDRGDSERAVENMRAALQEPELLALVGLTSSDRVQAVISGLGREIADSGVPYIADNSVNDIWSAYPNVFSTRPSQTEGRAPVISAFLKTAGYKRIAIIANDSQEYSKAVANAVAAELGPELVAGDERVLMGDNGRLEESRVAEAVGAISSASPDLVLIAVGSSRTDEVLKAMQSQAVTPPVFVVGSLDRIDGKILSSYPSPLFELAWEWLPEIYNSRIGDLVTDGAPGEWIFTGERNGDAPGWADGTCKDPDAALAGAEPDPLDKDNLRAVSRGTQFADMVALVARSANSAPPGSDLSTRRKSVVRALSHTYASGRQTFRGPYNDWSFDADTRVAVRPTFVVIKPNTLERSQLAPIQFLRLRDGSLRQIDTLYIDIDMIRAHRVDDNEKSFFAEFYLAMRANAEADIDRIEFTNAAVNPLTEGRQLTIEVVHGGSDDRAFPPQMKIYRVSGRFMFQPELGSYPFDTQRFSIDIQPKNGKKAFLVQPPPLHLRDQDIDSDDWQPLSQFVGLNEDFVPVVDSYAHEPSVVPFYQARYVWLMKREVTDYFLRVVVPLAFILIVAYVSIFIPQSHFEAIVTIQVTALLSAVALYLSLPQLDSDTATLSDRIFLFDYMMVSLMIVISILRINRFVARSKWLKGALATLHVMGIPLMVAAMGWYIYDLSRAGGV